MRSSRRSSAPSIEPQNVSAFPGLELDMCSRMLLASVAGAQLCRLLCDDGKLEVLFGNGAASGSANATTKHASLTGASRNTSVREFALEVVADHAPAVAQCLQHRRRP